MTSELTSEEIVTKLLTSNSIVKGNTDLSTFSSPAEYNLSDFIEDEQINNFNYEPENFPTKVSFSKYTFIKNV